MNTFIKDNWLKFIAIVFLLGALADNPYVYYQILRWVVSGICFYYVWKVWKTDNPIKKVFIVDIIIMAFLFNPIFPTYLSRNTWQIIDVVSAILLFQSMFRKLEQADKYDGHDALRYL